MASEARQIKTAVEKLEKELQEKDEYIKTIEGKLRNMYRDQKEREAEIQNQSRELNKLRSVLQEVNTLIKSNNTKGDGHNLLLSTIQEQFKVAKKQGVSGQSLDPEKAKTITQSKVPKDYFTRHQLREALAENDFLKHLTPWQVREMIDYMEQKKIKGGSYVIKQGEPGNHLYVAVDGDFEVTKDGEFLGFMGPGKAFGELAVLYNCKRTASVRASTPAVVWTIDREVFHKIMVKTGVQQRQDQLQFLKVVPLLSKLPEDILLRLSDAFELVSFPKGEYIVKQGSSGNVFYIISEGQVKVTRKLDGQDEEEIRVLSRGDYFGEQALLKTEFRTANVIADTLMTECLALDRTSFLQLVGDLKELKEKDYGDLAEAMKMQLRPIGDKKVSREFENLALDDLKFIAVLGRGGFGRVGLVQTTLPGSTEKRSFALKCLKKSHIVETKQQEHVYNEKRIMMNCNHQFIANLYRTFKDRKYVYLLMEVCLGGELWTTLRDKGHFDDLTTRFYTACVISAIGYLHSRGVIYRDMKPENLLLDEQGYVKMVDFGFARVLDQGKKSWTFCGTPEYVAPEIILNKGHDHAVDFWSLGILMCELLMGTPPFSVSGDHLKLYNIILRGIDQIHFPRHVTKTAINIIKRFCKPNPTERLGYRKDGIEDIKKHKWFEGFDWLRLETKTMRPPFVPKITSNADISNFDKFSIDANDIPPDELSGWDETF